MDENETRKQVITLVAGGVVICFAILILSGTAEQYLKRDMGWVLWISSAAASVLVFKKQIKWTLLRIRDFFKFLIKIAKKLRERIRIFRQIWPTTSCWARRVFILLVVVALSILGYVSWLGINFVSEIWPEPSIGTEMATEPIPEEPDSWFGFWLWFGIIFGSVTIIGLAERNRKDPPPEKSAESEPEEKKKDEKDGEKKKVKKK